MADGAVGLEVELRAKVADFEKQLLRTQNKTDAALKGVENRFANANRRVKKEADGLGGALGGLKGAGDKLLNTLPGLGGGMSALGIAGAGAAVGIGALVASLNGLKGAATWADDLAAAAERIGVTSEALQELRFAADETDIPLATLESGLEALNASLGAFKTGIGAGRITPVFKALGLTKEDLAGVENARDLLPILADRLGQVSDRATQVQLAKKLGIQELLPLLREGSSGINRLAQEGRDLGLVLSNDVVNGLADTSRELERNQQMIDANVTQMQASMAPFFVWATRELAKLAQGIGDIFNGIRNVENRTDRVIQGQIDDLQKRVDHAMRMRATQPGGRFTPVQERWFSELGALRTEQSSRRRQRETERGPSAAERATFTVDIPDTERPARRGRGGGGDSAARTAERAAAEALRNERAFADDLTRAQNATMEAQSQLAMTAEQRASVAMQLLDSERQQRRVELDRRVTDGDLTAAQRDQLIEAERGLWIAKEANVTAGLQRTIMEEAWRIDDQTRGAALELLAARAANAHTAEDRLDLERQILALHQQERRRQLERALVQEGISDAEKAMLRAMLDNLAAVEAAEQNGLLSPGEQAASDAIGASRSRRDATGRINRDRQDGMAYVDNQLATGAIDYQAAADARLAIDQAYWMAKLTGEGQMLDQLATLQNSSIKELAAIGKAAAIAQATIQGYVAVQNALATGGPFPANLVSAAIVGAQAAANVAAIVGTGFETGGYTGNVGTKQVAGVVHGQEYVFDAASTRRIGVGNLEALRSGGMGARLNALAAGPLSAGGGASPSITFSPTIHAPGADIGAVRRIEAVLDEQRRSFTRDVRKVMSDRERFRMGRRDR